MKTTSVGPLLFVLMLCCAVQSICSSLHGNETDRFSLFEFKKAISLDPQQALISWNDSTHFCSWKGVSCRKKAPPRVISLDLTNRGLVGQISSSLGNLTFLKFLYLDTNSFTGEIPLSFGRMHRLQILHLSNNTLEGKTPDFTNCSNLKTLLLNGNRLVGQWNSNYPPQLEYLDLANNNLTGTIPSSLANITGLRGLSFMFNNIKGNIPNEFSKFVRMEYLTASGNMLAGSFPQAILNLSTLIDLYIGFNYLNGELPSNLLDSLPSIQTLALGYNLFQGHMPRSLGNTSKLGFLDISNSSFTGVVPSSIGKLTKLYHLNLEYNQLQAHRKQDWDFMNSLANCTGLQVLSIAYNRLEGHLPSSLGNLSSLQRLYLGGNQISGVLPPGLENLSNLTIFSISENVLTGVLPECLGSLKHLQILRLFDNDFTGFIPPSFSNLSQLVYVYLDYNKFDGHIPLYLGSLKMLSVFTASNNNLHGSIPNEIFSIPSITAVDLSFNNLDGRLPTDIGNARQLLSLTLASNKLFGDIPNALGDCESLEEIDLSWNSFTGIIPASIGKITSLKVLNFSHNNLTGSIPLLLCDLHFLKQLDLSFNHLEGEVPIKGIFHNVTALNIDGNKGLCGGSPELHLLACPIMASVSLKHTKSIVLKALVPIASLVSLAMAISILIIRRGNLTRGSLLLPSFHSNFAKISYNNLFKATEGFSTSSLIGRGRFSSVYVGKLFQDNMVAVKVFNLETRGAHESFMAECNALRNVRHRNLLPILTACSSIDSRGNDFKALVYEFMSQGDLHKLLYTTRDGIYTNLNQITLAQRISIVVDVSDALEYLHHNNQGTIVHCDLKPSNILLDDGMIAHVGDFGLARFKTNSPTPSIGDPNSTSSVAMKGTIGYIAPEYSEGGQVSTASDVYSFGVVLLEIFIRRRPTDDMFKDGLSIAKYAEINFPDRILEIVDPQLQQELNPCQETPMAAKEKGLHWLRSVLSIGLCCTKTRPSERISMQEAAAKLHGIRNEFLKDN